MNIKISNKQPNIGLLKIFHNNKHKHDLAEELNKHMKNFNIIVYTGKGSVLYLNKSKKIIGKSGLCIAQTLQTLKDKKNKYPILIITYNMASRSQTFKSIDHEWTLTHFFIDLPKTSSVEQTLQALRCNGQYKNSDPIVQIFVSKETDDRIRKLSYNNDLYIQTCKTSHDNDKNTDMRKCIDDINFLNVPKFKMSNRKGVDDTKLVQFLGDGFCNDYDEAEKLAKILVRKNECDKYVYVSDKHFVIPCKKIVNHIRKHKEYNRNDNENIYNKLKTIFKDDANERFKELTTAQQNFLRNIVLFECKNKYVDLQINECQIGYSNKRTRILNDVNHKKLKNYQSQIICEILENGDISVMIYRDDYYNNPESFNNMVLIWKDTNKGYHLCVNKANPTCSFVSLKHISGG